MVIFLGGGTGTTLAFILQGRFSVQGYYWMCEPGKQTGKEWASHSRTRTWKKLPGKGIKANSMNETVLTETEVALKTAIIKQGGDAKISGKGTGRLSQVHVLMLSLLAAIKWALGIKAPRSLLTLEISKVLLWKMEEFTKQKKETFNSVWANYYCLILHPLPINEGSILSFQ